MTDSKVKPRPDCGHAGGEVIDSKFTSRARAYATNLKVGGGGKATKSRGNAVSPYTTALKLLASQKCGALRPPPVAWAPRAFQQRQVSLQPADVPKCFPRSVLKDHLLDS